MRVPQPDGDKGSLKWVQKMLGKSPNPIETAIRGELDLDVGVDINWKSPRAADDNAEYRDETFLEVIGLDRLKADLRKFWPSRGPQWDALGVASDGKVILVEAKAHVSEMTSTCTAGTRSRETIDRALQTTKEFYRVNSSSDWVKGYYQYANRLAHVTFLRQRGVDAHLVFIYFLNDRDVRGPISALGWGEALDECYFKLGLAKNQPIDGVHSIFIDVS